MDQRNQTDQARFQRDERKQTVLRTLSLDQLLAESSPRAAGVGFCEIVGFE